jgi:GNAT superfamily N-acetyltransferase
MKIIPITKRMFVHDRGHADWAGDGAVGAIGGPYADMLCAFADDDDPISLVAMAGGRAVGRINLLKSAVILKGERIDVFWGSGFVVPPEQRATGAGLALMARMRSIAPGTGAVSVSQMALPLYQKLGWIGLSAPRYVLPATLSNLLRHRFGPGGLVRAGGWMIDRGIAVYRAIWRTVLGVMLRGYTVSEITRYDETEHGPFGPYTSQPYATERSSAWLNRIMSEGPQENNRRLFVVRNRQRKVVGYFITTVAMRHAVDEGRYGDLEVATLRDWVSFDPAEAPEADILALGLRELLKVRCDVVEISLPPTQSARLLRMMGMLRKGELSFMVRLAPATQARFPDLSDPSKWWFRPGDGDAFLL